MEDFSVSDYGIFEDAIAKIKKLYELIDKTNTDIKSYKEQLSNESVFQGPICDECLAGFDKITPRLDLVFDNFQKIAEYMAEIAPDYKEGDSSAVKKIIGLDDKGKIEVKTLTDVISDYLNPANLSKDSYQYNFLQQILPGALKIQEKYGVPVSLTLAVAIGDTGWGQHSVKDAKNLFGIKAGSNWTGRVVYAETKEQNPDGSWVTITDAFRAYDSYDDAIEDFGNLLASLDRYKGVINAKSAEEACYKIKEGGYATANNYPEYLMNFIKTYGLDQWDVYT